MLHARPSRRCPVLNDPVLGAIEGCTKVSVGSGGRFVRVLMQGHEDVGPASAKLCVERASS